MRSVGLTFVGMAAAALGACASAPARIELPPTPPPHPNSITGQLSRPWHHVGSQVSDQRFAQDQAKCKVIGASAPENNEIKFDVIFINCMKAAGYEPDPPKFE